MDRDRIPPRYTHPASSRCLCRTSWHQSWQERRWCKKRPACPFPHKRHGASSYYIYNRCALFHLSRFLGCDSRCSFRLRSSHPDPADWAVRPSGTEGERSSPGLFLYHQPAEPHTRPRRYDSFRCSVSPPSASGTAVRKSSRSGHA